MPNELTLRQNRDLAAPKRPAGSSAQTGTMATGQPRLPPPTLWPDAARLPGPEQTLRLSGPASPAAAAGVSPIQVGGAGGASSAAGPTAGGRDFGLGNTTRTASPGPGMTATPSGGPVTSKLPGQVARGTPLISGGLAALEELGGVSESLRNPYATGTDTATQVAEGTARTASRIAGAGMGANVGGKLGMGLGAMTGPFAPVAVPTFGALGALGGGYLGDRLGERGANALIEGGRSLAGDNRPVNYNPLSPEQQRHRDIVNNPTERGTVVPPLTDAQRNEAMLNSSILAEQDRLRGSSQLRAGGTTGNLSYSHGIPDRGTRTSSGGTDRADANPERQGLRQPMSVIDGARAQIAALKSMGAKISHSTLRQILQNETARYNAEIGNETSLRTAEMQAGQNPEDPARVNRAERAAGDDRIHQMLQRRFVGKDGQPDARRIAGLQRSITATTVPYIEYLRSSGQDELADAVQQQGFGALSDAAFEELLTFDDFRERLRASSGLGKNSRFVNSDNLLDFRPVGVVTDRKGRQGIRFSNGSFLALEDLIRERPANRVLPDLDFFNPRSTTLPGRLPPDISQQLRQ